MEIRIREKCVWCNGDGASRGWDLDGKPQDVDCPKCHGSGWIERWIAVADLAQVVLFLNDRGQKGG